METLRSEIINHSESKKWFRVVYYSKWKLLKSIVVPLLVIPIFFTLNSNEIKSSNFGIALLTLCLLYAVAVAPVILPILRLHTPQLKIGVDGIWTKKHSFIEWKKIFTVIEKVTKGRTSTYWIFFYDSPAKQKLIGGVELEYLDISKAELVQLLDSLNINSK